MMTRTLWPVIAAVFAGLLACSDDDAPQQPGDDSTSGPGGVTLTTVSSWSTSGDITTSGPTTTVDTTLDITTTATTGTTTGATTSPEPSTGAESGGTTTATTSAGETGPETTGGGAAVACEGKIWACGDGIDNDGDGKIDNADFECISPCDDDEGSFQTDLPGMAEDCKNDCYWDLDSGAGQDKCEYNLKCDAENPGGQIGCGFVDECAAQTPPACIDFCVPLIPNGCDCFGCCHVDTPDGLQDFYLDSSGACALDDLAACDHCTFQEQCANPCQGCEVCFGEKGPPAGCDPDEGEQCEAGQQTCTMGGDECPDSYYCQTGCCQLIIPG